MTGRSWLLALAMLLLTAGGIWVGLALANAHSTKAGDCCLDPTCPPGCSPDCPPDCLDLSAKAKTKAAAKASCCPDGECCATDPARPTTASVTKKYICPPCPFCPGW